ncbi:2965_t:CDS:1, partial [Gigaspora margarita]
KKIRKIVSMALSELRIFSSIFTLNYNTALLKKSEPLKESCSRTFL